MTIQTKPPARLKKVTTRYSRVEDRVRLDVEVEGGSTQVYWLTQRMCREIVLSLVGYFNKAGLGYSDATPQNQRAVQNYLHQNARSSKKKTAPVASRRDGAILLDRVRLKTTRKAIQMMLPLPNGEAGMFVFSSDEARQWMDILYKQYEAAEWPVDVWPDWIREGAQADSASSPPMGKPVH